MLWILETKWFVSSHKYVTSDYFPVIHNYSIHVRTSQKLLLRYHLRSFNTYFGGFSNWKTTEKIWYPTESKVEIYKWRTKSYSKPHMYFLITTQTSQEVLRVYFSLSILQYHSSFLYIFTPKNWDHGMFLCLDFYNLYFCRLASQHFLRNSELNPKPFFWLDTLSIYNLSRSLCPSKEKWNSKSIFLQVCITEHLKRNISHCFLLWYHCVLYNLLVFLLPLFNSFLFIHSNIF